jgi:hypothetical protein
MTDGRRGLLSVALGAFAAFELIALLLVVQMRLGRDPALGAARAAAPPPRHVLVRRVVQRRVIVRLLPARDDSRPGRGGQAVVITRPAPAPAAGSSAARVTQAPTPAPAPAPPLTTRPS